ncbi:MAG: DNA polymerase III subunit beta, partial [Alphaproteobacteria bacterium]|nr:DNA polymerase III subunit beta [Alphaproteobacteria bacterium]
MKLTVERSELLKSLTHVQGVVERKNTIPILSNIMLEAEDSRLKLKATDLDIEITEIISVEIMESGSITAPAHMLYDIVRKLPEGSQVEISSVADADKISIISGRSRFSLASISADEFPAIASDDMPVSFKLAAEELRALIDKTRFAVSTEETRYYLNGIYVHAKKNEDTSVLRAAATDGHRLACVEVSLPEGAENITGIIIPRKTIAEIRKLVDET